MHLVAIIDFFIPLIEIISLIASSDTYSCVNLIKANVFIHEINFDFESQIETSKISTTISFLAKELMYLLLSG